MTADFNAAMARLRVSAERLADTLGQLQMRRAMDVEPSVLPRWRVRTRMPVRTQYLRRDYNMADVAYLRTLLAAPDALSAVRAYQKSHQRVLQGKRRAIEADPDPVCTEWRDRPARVLTAREMATKQFTGRALALARELRRIK